MSRSTPVRFAHVSKDFQRRGVADKYRTLKGILAGADRGAVSSFRALHDVSLSVDAGETFGLIGANGAGKSTLLKLAAGIYRPDEGSLDVRGRIGSLIEIGLGFHREFSGRENVLLSGMLQGLTRTEAEQRFDEIVDFADLGDFIDEPVRTYSSGMYMRLGFSIAIHTRPDVLLVDEVLAVGDAAFQRRCIDRLLELQAAGTTILMATHFLDIVLDHCRRAMWLEHGRVRALGPAHEVVAAYQEAVAEAYEAENAEAP